MPFLDAVHLSFGQSATIENEASIFGKEWRVTLEYVFHQPGLRAAYVSWLSGRHDMWIFLVWATEDDRSHFYHQTTGFGNLSDYMKKAPSAFFFRDDDYASLDETGRWTIYVLVAVSRNGSAPERLSPQQEKQFLRYPGRYNFIARLEKAEFDKLYEGNDFDHALVGITNISSGGSLPDSALSSKREVYEVELKKCEKSLYPTPSPGSINAPVDIADLTSKQPWEYGVLSCDDGEYKDTAYPMSLSFRPMSTMHVADNFQPEGSRRNSMDTEVREQFTVCIVSASIQPITEDGRDATPLEALRKKLGLLDGLDGLRELRVLRTIAHNDESEFVRFACSMQTPPISALTLTITPAWRSLVDLTRWWQDTGSGANAYIDYTWTSERIGWKDLMWDSMPLTPNKGHWQKIDKILEIVDFTFTQDLTAAEKSAVEGHLYTLISTMSSCWSGDIDEQPVVYAETPVWATTEGKPSSCLLFVAWDGVEQRRAWLRNFVADSYSWIGYIAHTLGLVCSRVKSGTYEIETLYNWQETCDEFARLHGEDEDDSDRDMGF